jgi:hypothetical protein
MLTIGQVQIQQDEANRFRLNDLHTASGGEKRHQPANWLGLQQTQELIAQLGIKPDPEIPGAFKNQPVNVVSGYGKAQGTYVCKELVYAYAMWISPAFHLQVIRAYDSMQVTPSTQVAADPVIAALVHSLLEIDRLKQGQSNLNRQTANLEQRLNQLEQTSSPNGVPAGFLSKTQAHYKYAQGLSRQIFQRALATLNVPSTRYIHQENGHATPSVAYKENDISSAIDSFLADAKQVSKAMCESPMLQNARFRYVKT